LICQNFIVIDPQLETLEKPQTLKQVKDMTLPLIFAFFDILYSN